MNQAIAEWPTASGPADYVLFAGLAPVAVVEAKKQIVDVPGRIPQAQRYSKDYELHGNEVFAAGPWGEYKVPFVFATNGRRYLRQIQEKSGIWFQDVRQATNHPRALDGWYSPDGLLAMLEIDVAKAEDDLRQIPLDHPGLRDYQSDAIKAVDDALTSGQREILVAMATGTGKTRLCLFLLYRFIKAKRFRRILFLVDREALGEQAANTFKEVKIESLHSFAEIYEIKELADVKPDTNTRVHLATVQGMVSRLLYPSEGELPVPIDQYDCVVVDECHRGYNLDRELSDAELLFKDEQDYISKYRRVLDHFDAVKIGLTATPALQTTDIFGKPVYTYTYRQAVIDGWLVDHEPPVRFITALAESGIHWKKGEQLKVFDSTSGKIDTATAPDEIDFDVEEFNRKVVTEPFNTVVCDELAKEIDPNLPGKTLIFCVSNNHADLVIRLLKDAMEKQYGPLDDDVVVKITAAVDNPLLLVRRFKNEQSPKIAVTVDLLTTGIDVPEIVNLVFIRRIKSRILYEQMLGRATRLCPNLFGPGLDKEVFRIFDAVDIYSALAPFSTMKPVVADPNITVTKILLALAKQKYEPGRKALHEELLAKLQRKKSTLLRNSEKLQRKFGVDASTLVRLIRSTGASSIHELFKKYEGLAKFIDELGTGINERILISEHPDELVSKTRGYGGASKPEDYLQGFDKWLKENLNRIPALRVVVQRPRELTRQQLKEIKLVLDEAGYTELTLQTAWREWKNQDIAATIVGFIRHRAMGAPLLPYAERVEHALQATLNSRQWTAPQRQWLQRLANQIKTETIVDRKALDRGIFAANGGFPRLNKAFDGQLETIINEFHDRIWQDAAA